MTSTLDDLAAIIGVSRATVSRVINGGPVAEATRTKVLEALEANNYRPNLAARSLASGRTGVVGLVMHAPAVALFTDPYFSLLLQGITETLADQATGVMLWLSHLSKEETLHQILSTNFIDGIICTDTMLEDPLVDGLLASHVPTVLIGHRRQDESANYVDIDNEGATEDVVDHLVAVGRRRIGHITGARGTVSGEARIVGYHRALDRAGITERFVVDGDYTVAGGQTAMKELLGMEVDAVYAASDHTAMGAYRTIKEAGLGIPDDIAVAGFDDLPFGVTLDPPLTTVRQSVAEQGVIAAQSLVRLLEHGGGRRRRVIVPTELVIRRSTTGGALSGG